MTNPAENRNSNHFIENVRQAILRGGRMTKYKGQAASCAPMLGVVAVALMSSAAVMLTPTTAFAGTCTETFAGSGIWTCTGATAADIDTTQTLTPATGGALTVSTTAGFGIDTTTALSKSFVLNSSVGQTNITFTDTNSAAITGSGYGISAYNHGTGATSVTTTGTVNGIGSLGIGMYVANANTATNLTISAASVTGGAAGISAKNFGTGATGVTASGAVSSAAIASGIMVASHGTNLTVSTAGVTGGTTGIKASSYGTGAMSVTASGAVVGTTGNGIYALNTIAGTGLSVSAATVTGGTTGILTKNYGSGATSITATGTVTGAVTSGAGHNGIYANTSGTNLTVSAAAVTGGNNGIDARNAGTGSTSVTASGLVTAYFGSGIYARNATTTTGGLTVSASAVSGHAQGIQARNLGSGSTSVSASGLVTATLGDGIYAYTLGFGAGGLAVNAAAVTGHASGIKATNLGAGATSVTVSGAVTGTTGYGIYAYTYGTDVTVNAAAVTGGTYGILTKNNGTGAISVTATGAVTGGASFNGINVFSTSTTTGGLAVSAAAVTGGVNGINATNNGTGATSVTATGAVTGTSTNGIFAQNSSTATDLTVSAAAVTGGSIGIHAVNYGTGATTITASGAVIGGTGYGINTIGANTTITLNAGAAVSSTAGKGILNGVGNSSTTVNTGASVAGSIVLGAGSDSLTFAGGSFGAVTTLDGGTGTDVLNFNGPGGSLTGANVLNWETVAIGAGSTIALTGALTAGSLTVASGGVLNAAGNLALTGNLANSGTVTLQNGAVGDAATVSGNFAGVGALNMDINTTADTADTLAIAGNSSGATLVTVTNLTPTVATGNDITLVTVAGTSAATDFTLAGGPLTYGAFNYDLKYQGGSFVLGQLLNSTGSTYLASSEILSGFNNLPSMEQRIDGREQRIGHAGWISFHGGTSKAVLTGGNRTNSDIYGIQVGTDLEFNPGDNGRWVLGVSGQYGKLNSTMIDPALGTGKIDTTGYGLGLSATWYSNEGTYVDAQGQVNWLSSDLSSSSAGVLVKGHNSTAYALSLEGGHRFIMGSNTALVPQVQLTWGSIDGGSFTDSVGNSVNLKSNDSTIGRVGMAYEFNRKGDAQKFYVIGNILHDFSSKSSVTVAGINMNTDLANPTSASIGFGGTQVFGKMEIYGEANFRSAVNGSHINDDRGFGGTLGFRMTF